MRGLSTATLLCAALSLTIGTARADDADDLAEIVRIDALLHAKLAPTLRVHAAELDGVRLDLRDPARKPKEYLDVIVASGSTWIDKSWKTIFGNPCPDSGPVLSAFSLSAGMRAYFQARAIAHDLDAGTLAPMHFRFATVGNGCEPRWAAVSRDNDARSVDLEFTLDGKLTSAVVLLREPDFIEMPLDPTELAALDQRTRGAIPSPRAEAEALAAEAEIIEPVGDEYLVASIDGKAYMCASEDIQLMYDFYRLELECKGDATKNTLFMKASDVKPGKSEHRMEPTISGPLLWYRDGLLELQSDEELLDTRIWIDTLSTTLVEGRFEGTVTTALGRRKKISGGRFRLLPSAGFRVTPP